MSTPRKVVYWNNVPSPYMVDRFNAIARRGNLDFQAWFSNRTADTYSWRVDESKWQFSYRYLPRVRTFSRSLAVPTFVFDRHRPDLVVSLFADSEFIAGWPILHARRIPQVFWVEATFDYWPWIKRKRWKDAIRKFMFRNVDGIITVGDDGRRYAERFGASSEKIKFARHSINVDHFSALSMAARNEREELRAHLHLVGFTVVFVGRLVPLKGLIYLLEAFRMFAKASEKPASLLIVGDGPDEKLVEQFAAENPDLNIRLVGFQHEEVLPSFYAIADVMVFPSLGDTYGLVIDEAMASGLPVIASNAVAELALRIREGENGYIVKAASSCAIFEKLVILSKEPELLQRMSQRSRYLIDGSTPDRWAHDFEAAVNFFVQSRNLG